MKISDSRDRAWALFVLRASLGVMFLFAGADKLFQVGPLQYAQRLSADFRTVTYVPGVGVWACGTVIPFFQLLVGVLLLVGLWTRVALWAVGGALVIQTFAAGLASPGLGMGSQVNFYVLSRMGLMFLLLLQPAEADRYSIDRLLAGSRPDEDEARKARAATIFVARTVLGTVFFFAGIQKVFLQGPIRHAQDLFIGPYKETILPVWGLWASGVSIPFFELIAGALVLVGLWTRPMVWLFAAELIFVTFGHFMNAPVYVLNLFILPRLALTLFVLFMPREDDILSLDHLLARGAHPDVRRVALAS